MSTSSTGGPDAVDESLAERLRTEKNIWLCTVRSDGSPHLTPIWFAFDDGAFWVCTGIEALKTRNVRHHPKVSLGLEDGNRPVVVEGEAVVHERPYPDHVVAAFWAKFGWDISRVDDPDGPYDALWEVRPTRWLMGGPAG